MSGREVLNEYNEMLSETIANRDDEFHELSLAREVHKVLCRSHPGSGVEKFAWEKVLEHSRMYNFLSHRIKQLTGRIRIWGERLGLID